MFRNRLLPQNESRWKHLIQLHSKFEWSHYIRIFDFVNRGLCCIEGNVLPYTVHCTTNIKHCITENRLFWTRGLAICFSFSDPELNKFQIHFVLEFDWSVICQSVECFERTLFAFLNLIIMQNGTTSIRFSVYRLFAVFNEYMWWAFTA